MINWRDGKAGFVGASKRLIKGVFRYSHTVTTEDVSPWTEAAGNASIWAVQNPTATTWDAGGTLWDLNGNTYITFWDGIDNTWSNQTGNAVTWTTQ